MIMVCGFGWAPCQSGGLPQPGPRPLVGTVAGTGGRQGAGGSTGFMAGAPTV
jgi:hypothetical protein